MVDGLAEQQWLLLMVEEGAYLYWIRQGEGVLMLGNVKDEDTGMRKRSFYRHFCINAIFSPRQAREKHRAFTVARPLCLTMLYVLAYAWQNQFG